MGGRLSSVVAQGAPAHELAPGAAKPVERAKARLSCVIPCRNEATNLDLLLPQLRTLLARLVPAWEIILVDDGSTDATPLRVPGWTEAPGVRVIQLSRSFGKEAALTAGLKAANGDIVVMMDADLQHPPALIKRFIELWREGADMVYAVRRDREDETCLKRWGAGWFYRLINLTDRFEVPAGAGDFRLLDRSVVDTLLHLPERNRFMKGLYAWLGFDARAVPYQPEPRASGSSHYSPLKLLRLSVDALTAFTTWPLRAISGLGFVLAVLALSYGIYLTGVYFIYGHPLGGWTTIVVSLMLFAGIQMISLGIVGEYVGRIFEEVKARPLYVVRRQWGRGLDDEPP